MLSNELTTMEYRYLSLCLRLPSLVVRPIVLKTMEYRSHFHALLERLVHPKDSRSYADGSVATGRISHVGQVLE